MESVLGSESLLELELGWLLALGSVSVSVLALGWLLVSVSALELE